MSVAIMNHYCSIEMNEINFFNYLFNSKYIFIFFLYSNFSLTHTHYIPQNKKNWVWKISSIAESECHRNELVEGIDSHHHQIQCS